MKHCEKCKIDVNTLEEHCPLCFNRLEEKNGEGVALYSVTHEKPRTIVKNHLLSKIFLLISIGIIAVCGFINFMTKGMAWSVLVGASVIYMWILVRHSILSTRNTFEKIFFQVLSIILLLLCTNWISGGGNWFVDYVFPSIIASVTIILDMVLLCTKRRTAYLLSFFIIQLILLIITIIFVCISVCTNKLMFAIALFVNALSIVAILILGGKPLGQDFVKKFHL